MEGGKGRVVGVGGSHKTLLVVIYAALFCLSHKPQDNAFRLAGKRVIKWTHYVEKVRCFPETSLAP